MGAMKLNQFLRRHSAQAPARLASCERPPAGTIIDDLARIQLGSLSPTETGRSRPRNGVGSRGGGENRLTLRQTEVLELLCSGMTAREIAAELVLAVPTVQRHIQNIYVKINARRRADAVRYYMNFAFLKATDSNGDGSALSRIVDLGDALYVNDRSPTIRASLRCHLFHR